MDLHFVEWPGVTSVWNMDAQVSQVPHLLSRKLVCTSHGALQSLFEAFSDGRSPLEALLRCARAEPDGRLAVDEHPARTVAQQPAAGSKPADENSRPAKYRRMSSPPPPPREADEGDAEMVDDAPYAGASPSSTETAPLPQQQQQQQQQRTHASMLRSCFLARNLNGRRKNVVFRDNVVEHRKRDRSGAAEDSPSEVDAWTYVDKSGSEQGPLTAQELGECLRSGLVTQHTLVTSLKNDSTLSVQRVMEAEAVRAQQGSTRRHGVAHGKLKTPAEARDEAEALIEQIKRDDAEEQARREWEERVKRHAVAEGAPAEAAALVVLPPVTDAERALIMAALRADLDRLLNDYFKPAFQDKRMSSEMYKHVNKTTVRKVCDIISKTTVGKWCTPEDAHAFMLIEKERAKVTQVAQQIWDRKAAEGGLQAAGSSDETIAAGASDGTMNGGKDLGRFEDAPSA